MQNDFDDIVRAIALLNEDLRKRLYEFIAGQGRAVTREEAAGAMGISTNLAAFHLDKLVDHGLLTARYGRPPGSERSTGRTPKVYDISGVELELSLPQRHYDKLAEIVLSGLATRRTGETPATAAARVARERGQELGSRVGRRLRLQRPSVERTVAVMTRVLDEYGYRPYEDETGSIRLRNCPFRRLASDFSSIICPLNHAFIEGALRGLGNESVEVLLQPNAPECCVTVAAPD